VHLLLAQHLQRRVGQRRIDGRRLLDVGTGQRVRIGDDALVALSLKTRRRLLRNRPRSAAAAMQRQATSRDSTTGTPPSVNIFKGALRMGA